MHRLRIAVPNISVRRRENLAAHGIHACSKTWLLPVSTARLGDSLDQRRAPVSNPGAARSIAAAISLDLVRHRVAVALGFGIAPSARSAEATCSSNSSSSARIAFGAVLDDAHGGFGAIEPRIGGTSYRQPFGCGTFFSQVPDSATLNRSDSFCRAPQLLLQRSFSKRSDRAELALKKLALKNAMAIPPRIAIVRRISGPISLNAKSSLKLG